MEIVNMKRWIALLLAALLVVSIIPAAAASGDEQPQPAETPAVTAATLVGDVNLDGKVDVMDVTAMQKALARDKSLSEDELRVYDTQGDGSFTISDATEIQRYIAEMPYNPVIGMPLGEAYPGVFPTEAPTEQPTEAPSEAPTEPVTEAPTAEPTQAPTEQPTQAPTEQPTEAPTEAPTEQPTQTPTEAPTEAPTEPATLPAVPTVITLNAEALTLGVEEHFQLTAESDAAVTLLRYHSNQPEVAEVTDSGLIQAKQTGEAIITCTDGTASAACTVTVCPAATSLTLNKTALTLGVGESYDLNSTVNAGAAAHHRFYYSDNKEVAPVTLSGGIVTAQATGTANISCVLLNGVKAVCAVTVLPMADSLTLNRTAVSLTPGGSFDFNSSIPKNTAAFHRAYYSEDPEIVSITKSGGIATGQKEGKTRIYCEINGGTRAYATVTVAEMPEIRTVMVEHLRAQVGNHNTPYVQYINARSNLNVTMSFPWCAVFAWSALDQFATKIGRPNPLQAAKHVSDIAEPARRLGALHNIYDYDYTPKPGDLFCTSALKRPIDGGRDHIGYVESVDTDASGKVIRVHTIEGNYAWEVNGAFDTYVWRGTWVPGVPNEYQSAMVEFIDIEKLFNAQT